MSQTLRIGTRGSKLALWQAEWVKTALMERFLDLSVEIVPIKTRGDKILDVPLAKVGGKGLFVKEIEEALLNGAVDMAVHSMKDMPADIPAGLRIGAVPEREDPRDVLISRTGAVLKDLPFKARIGTSSLRRAAQLKRFRPDITIVPLRGNLDTRLSKLESEGLSAIVLAAAGVKRMELADRVTEYLNPLVMLPAVGQGALCIEIRENDPVTESFVTQLDHDPTHNIVLGERAFLHTLEGGCQTPIAAHGALENGAFMLDGMVSDLTAERYIRKTLSGPAYGTETTGVKLAETLIENGAGRILEELMNAI